MLTRMTNPTLTTPKIPMNDQNPIKALRAQLDRIIALIKGGIKKLVRKIKGEEQEKKPPPKDTADLQNLFERVATAITSLGKKASKTKKKPRKSKSKHAGSKNKNKKRNKIRAKIAVESNRINRQRVKRWKH